MRRKDCLRQSAESHRSMYGSVAVSGCIVHTVINLSPETLNEYAEQLGAVAVRRLVRDHLRRDGAGGHAVPAGRLAALRGRGRRRPSRVADPARTAVRAAGRGRGAGRRRQLRDRLLRRAARLFARGLLAAEQEAPVRAQSSTRSTAASRSSCAVHPDRPNLRPVRRRHRQDELPAVRRLQRRGGTVWILFFCWGLVVRRRGRSENFKRDRRDHRDLGASGRVEFVRAGTDGTTADRTASDEGRRSARDSALVP